MILRPPRTRLGWRIHGDAPGFGPPRDISLRIRRTRTSAPLPPRDSIKRDQVVVKTFRATCTERHNLWALVARAGDLHVPAIRHANRSNMVAKGWFIRLDSARVQCLLGSAPTDSIARCACSSAKIGHSPSSRATKRRQAVSMIDQASLMLSEAPRMSSKTSAEIK